MSGILRAARKRWCAAKKICYFMIFFRTEYLNCKYNLNFYFHCMIHREVLVSKSLPEKLTLVLNELVKFENDIKGSTLRSRIFWALCDAIESHYKFLLYHTEVRWLSKRKVFDRFEHLKVEIVSFIETEAIEFEFTKNDVQWVQVQFLSDLFEKLLSLNLRLQRSRS